MSVKIIDILGTKLFTNSKFKIIAGKDGLENIITRVSFTDCDLPADLYNGLEDDIHLNIIGSGDFYISSLYFFKDDEDLMMNYFRYNIKSKSSGICIIDYYLDTLPPKVLEYANAHNYPVIIIDANIPYAEIIRVIMEMILLEESSVISEMKIDKILEDEISRDDVIKYARQINGTFNKYYTCLYCFIKNMKQSDLINLKSTLTDNSNIEILDYQSCLLIILNYNKVKALDLHIDYVISSIESYSNSYKIGVSNPFSEIEKFNVSIKQSMSAYEISYITEDTKTYYSNLKVYKILYPLRDSKYLTDFLNDTLGPIKAYDEKYNSELMDTISAFLENNGDYSKTGKAIHQHSNTVRYRIQKAKTILDLEKSHIDFIEQMSIGFKIAKVQENGISKKIL